MDTMLGELKEIIKDNMYKDHYLIMKHIVLDRWEKMNIPMHRLAPGGVERKPPNLDSKVMSDVLEAFRNITKKRLFAKLACQEDVVHMDPIDCWSTYGSAAPELVEVTKKVLSQPVSSSSIERNWSTYFYIHRVKRNWLNNARANTLIFIHSNIRLLSCFSKSYTSRPYKY
ncbi:hypothetical protein Cgig2_022603 [Carnegiea gigantea]|uniref:HAT C-terminal dimerisation domain-containing protein n=1 Tax=Carnegiea gigantea TaxID=171969 RepID=A0A9Q1GWP1_9CARY|nr:hypothetical protein Cgig2_022603 [Carnegiea gigantea]